MLTDEHLFSIALKKCPNVGNITYHKLVQFFGSAKNTWIEGKVSLDKINGISKKVFSEIGQVEHLQWAEKEIDYCQKNNIQILLRQNDELPFYLRECPDAPAILYQKGHFNQNAMPLSMVGTRAITEYGKTFVKELLLALRSHEVITISGLAYGVDAEGHVQSLANAIPTIGVLAHGFSRFYPAKHRELSERILANNGALITEFNSAQQPKREYFLQRNRIVAGLSRYLVVVETAFAGGSMSTATFANGYHREVFALPGNISQKYSQGCNQLIYQNKAQIINTISELIQNFGLNEKKQKDYVGDLFTQEKPKPMLSSDLKVIYDVIAERPLITLDEISEKIDVPVFQLLPILLDLEVSGFIASNSGRQFTII